VREVFCRWRHAAACALLIVPASTSLAAMKVVVERLADGAVRVDYVLDTEVTELAFVPAIGRGVPSARSTWTVLGNELILSGDRIASTTGSPFSAASVRIEPTLVMGRGRPTVVALGPRSSVVDLNRVLEVEGAQAISLKVRNAYDVRARACVKEHDVDDAARATNGAVARFVVVSTSRDACDEATHGGDPTVVAEDAPPELQLVAARELAGAYRRLTEKLGLPLDPAPTLIVAHRREGASVWVPPGVDSVVLARLEGDNWTSPTPYQANLLAFNLTQALVPSWLDGVVVPPTQPDRLLGHWLRGAPAQYLALLDRQSLGQPVHGMPAGRALLGDMDLCSRRVGESFRDLSTAVVPVDRDPQACGLLILFVYDAVTRAETAGRRTIFDIWADVLEEADGGPIDAEAFLATNERARAAVAGLVYGPTADFEAIAAVLRNAGIDASLGEPRDTGGAVSALLTSLVREDCSEGLRSAGPFIGDRIKIQTRGACRTLPQEVELISIAGQGILTSARAVYEATADACAARGRVTMTGALAAQEFEIDCPASVPALPQQLLIRNVHFLN